MAKRNGMVLVASIFLVIVIGIFVLFSIPWKGEEKNIYYTKGEDFCIIETRDKYINREVKSIVLREVVYTEGRYFYKIGSGRLIEFEVD